MLKGDHAESLVGQTIDHYRVVAPLGTGGMGEVYLAHDGGEPKKTTNFKADEIFSFDWSRDNELVLSLGTSTSDVVLIRNAK